MLAGLLLGINFLSINAYLKNTATHRHERELTDVLFELQQLLRQTDGARCVVSNTAVFDFDVYRHKLARQPKSCEGMRQVERVAAAGQTH
jgi:hypothetical protein